MTKKSEGEMREEDEIMEDKENLVEGKSKRGERRDGG